MTGWFGIEEEPEPEPKRAPGTILPADFAKLVIDDVMRRPPLRYKPGSVKREPEPVVPIFDWLRDDFSRRRPITPIAVSKLTSLTS